MIYNLYFYSCSYCKNYLQYFIVIQFLIFQYYLVNDTVEVRELHTPNDGRDPFPILISRQRIPKNRYDTPSTFPGIILELSENEINDYFTPRDFGIGKTVELYNRKFLLYDCDDFTKAFYWKNFGTTDFTPIRIDKYGKVIPQEVCYIYASNIRIPQSHRTRGDCGGGRDGPSQ